MGVGTIFKSFFITDKLTFEKSELPVLEERAPPQLSHLAHTLELRKFETQFDNLPPYL